MERVLKSLVSCSLKFKMGIEYCIYLYYKFMRIVLRINRVYNFFFAEPSMD
jgi:hypothetical protein